jgi:hypothetical protein
MSPYSRHEYSDQNELLSPVIIYDGGKTQGIISSKTTRRQGIVSSLDFAPYILDCYDIDYSGFTGYSYEFQHMNNNIEYISNLNSLTITTAESRLPILKGFAIFILTILSLYIVSLFKKFMKLASVVKFLMELALAVPFFMLIEGAFRINSINLKALFITLSSIAFTILINTIFKKPSDRILTIAIAIISGIAFDILSGQNMLHFSVLSYDPIIGARYYGLGNEFSGVLIGCSLILFGFIFNIGKKYLKYVLVLIIFISILIGFPWFGANTGCFITSVFTFLIFILLEREYSIKYALRISIIFSAASILAVIAVNLVFKNSESHLGKLVTQINTHGIEYLLNVVSRKLSMAFRLIRSTIWSSVFIGFIITSFIVFAKPYKSLKTRVGYYSSRNLWLCTIIACTTAIIFNDSGIVTSALIMLYGFFSMAVLLNSSG